MTSTGIRSATVTIEAQESVLELDLPINVADEDLFAISIVEFTHNGVFNPSDSLVKTVLAGKRAVYETINVNGVYVTNAINATDMGAVGDIMNSLDVDCLNGLDVKLKFVDNDGIPTYAAGYSKLLPSICVRCSDVKGFANRYGESTNVLAHIKKSETGSDAYILKSNGDDVMQLRTFGNKIFLEFLHPSCLVNERDETQRSDRRIYFTTPYTIKIMFYLKPNATRRI